MLETVLASSPTCFWTLGHLWRPRGSFPAPLELLPRPRSEEGRSKADHPPARNGSGCDFLGHKKSIIFKNALFGLKIGLDGLWMSITHVAAAFAMGVNAKNSFGRSKMKIFRRISNWQISKRAKFIKTLKKSNLQNHGFVRKVKATESIRYHF